MNNSHFLFTTEYTQKCHSCGKSAPQDVDGVFPLLYCHALGHPSRLQGLFSVFFFPFSLMGSSLVHSPRAFLSMKMHLGASPGLPPSRPSAQVHRESFHSLWAPALLLKCARSGWFPTAYTWVFWTTEVEAPLQEHLFSGIGPFILNQILFDQAATSS